MLCVMNGTLPEWCLARWPKLRYVLCKGVKVLRCIAENLYYVADNDDDDDNDGDDNVDGMIITGQTSERCS